EFFLIDLSYWAVDQSLLESVALEECGTVERAENRLVELTLSFDLLRNRLTNMADLGKIAEDLHYSIDLALETGKRIPTMIDAYFLSVRSIVALTSRCARRLWAFSSEIIRRSNLTTSCLHTSISLLDAFANGNPVRVDELERVSEQLSGDLLPESFSENEKE